MQVPTRVTKTAIGALMFMSLAAHAQDVPTAAALDDAFNQLQNIPGVVAHTPDFRITIAVKLGANDAGNYNADKTTILYVRDDPENVKQMLLNFHQIINDTCHQHGGTLNYVSQEAGQQPPDSLANAVKDARKQKLIGIFECSYPETVLFHVELRPTSINRFVRGQRGIHWGLVALGLGPDRLSRIQANYVTRSAALAEFRENLAPGSKVSVPASSVPVDTRPNGTLSSSYICALVVDVKNGLIQVQIGSKTIFVKTDEVQPEWKEQRGLSTFHGPGYCLPA